MSFYVGNIVDDDVTVVRIFFVSQSVVCGLQMSYTRGGEGRGVDTNGRFSTYPFFFVLFLCPR